MIRFPCQVLLAYALLLALTACQATNDKSLQAPEDARVSGSALTAVDLQAALDADATLAKLAHKQVVFIGETHDRYDHHLNQLEIIRGLHRIHADLVIGMEYFQQPFQRYLDEYVAGTLDEKALLKKTEYYSRWRFDYRLYRLILQYARQRQIPLLALNVPHEITHKVSESGIESLTEEESKQIPAKIDRSDEQYHQRLKQIFAEHPSEQVQDFKRFLDVQLLWDEGMAERAAQYLKENPRRHMVILAGSGHLAYGSGIPDRLKRRFPTDTAIVLSGAEMGLEPGIADLILLSQPRELPPQGLLGILMQDTESGVTVNNFAQKSAARDAGMEKGDVIVALNGEDIGESADVKLVMLDKRPGDPVRVMLRRNGGEDITLEFNLR